MIASVLEFSLRQRILVLGVACLLSIAGIVAFQSIPIDAYPDVTNIQVQVLTDAPGWSPVEVERFVTYPLELQMTGLPGLAEIRSLSKFALSQVTVVFQDNVDIYFARQLVLERGYWRGPLEYWNGSTFRWSIASQPGALEPYFFVRFDTTPEATVNQVSFGLPGETATFARRPAPRSAAGRP